MSEAGANAPARLLRFEIFARWFWDVTGIYNYHFGLGVGSTTSGSY